MTAGLDEALDRVERAADLAWLQAARLVLDARIRSGLPFTADDLWAQLDHVHTREPRAMGALIKAASKAGRIRRSGRFVPSTRRRGDSAVWHPVVDR